MSRRDRRRRLIVGGFVGLLVLALLAPLVAGLIPDTTDAPDKPVEPETTDGPDAPDAEPETTDGPDPPDAQDTVGAAGCPKTDGSQDRTTSFDAPPPMCIDPEQRHVAVFDTSEGEIRVALDSANVPATVNNFVTLARYGYYDDTTIFRTDTSIDIIQGGAPHTGSPSDPGPGYRIPDEPRFDIDAVTGELRGPYRYKPGQLVMARGQGADSAGAQFFFSTGNKAALLDRQGTYVVIGETDAAGLAVLEAVIGLHEPGPSLGGAPSRKVTVDSVTITMDAS